MMDQPSTSQVNSKGDIPLASSASDLDFLDIETPPERYSGQLSSQNSLKSSARDVDHASPPATRATSPDRRRTSVVQLPSNQPSGTQSRRQQQVTTPKDRSPGLLSIFQWFPSTTGPGSIGLDVDEQFKSFRRMETGRWLSMDKSRVQADFDRIRTQMRTWAKSTALENSEYSRSTRNRRRTIYVSNSWFVSRGSV